MTKTIVTNPQASIKTYVTDSRGNRRAAVVTAKQFIFNRVKDFHWHSVSEFTRRINHNGFRGRLAELTAAGMEFNRKYDRKGRLTHIQLKHVPGVGFMTATPARSV